MDTTKLVQKNRILDEFLKLAAYDSESYAEQGIAAYLSQELARLGLEVSTDRAASEIRARHPDAKGAADNIYGFWKGTRPGDSVLFCAHMDTVKPGKGKCPQVLADGRITSDATTVLGADDLSGIVSILEALRVIHEQGIAHPDIEVLLTAAEEPYCEGSRYVRYDKLKSKRGYVLDLTGPVGQAAIAAPTILSVDIDITGRAAHAGFAPEKGTNALSITADALSKLKTGWTSDVTTVNFGLIRGGTGSNIVPDRVSVQGEIRSLYHEEALQQAEQVTAVFRESAERFHGQVLVRVEERIHAYQVEMHEAVVQDFLAAAGETLRCRQPACITTNGGSDANRLNAHGIRTIVLSCGMEQCHSVDEYTTLEELTLSAALTVRLMLQEED